MVGLIATFHRVRGRGEMYTDFLIKKIAMILLMLLNVILIHRHGFQYTYVLLCESIHNPIYNIVSTVLTLCPIAVRCPVCSLQEQKK